MDEPVLLDLPCGGHLTGQGGWPALLGPALPRDLKGQGGGDGEAPGPAEETVVRRAMAGDQDAFTVLFDRYFPQVSRRILAPGGDASEAEDLAQEVFARAWRALRGYRQWGVPFRSWLFTIAHNLTIDWYRRRSRTHRLVQQVTTLQRLRQANPGDGLADRVCSRLTLRIALGRLKPEYRQVLELKFLMGLEYAEMARLLGKRESNVRTLVYRALKHLRSIVAAPFEVAA